MVDNNNNFLTQRQDPLMSLLQVAIENDKLVIFHKNNIADKIAVPLQPLPTATSKVIVWDDECQGQYVNADADIWLSAKLAMPCRLVYMPDSEKRKVDGRYARQDEVTSFSDGYPVLIIGQASLDDLNKRMPEPLPMDRFRPNLVFSGGQPYDEDTMEHVLVNNIDLYGVKLCSRCVLTTINQATALKAKEPLKTLASYRMKNNKIYFGQNILYGQTGSLKVGDIIEIIKSKPPTFVYAEEDNVDGKPCVL